MRVFSIVLCLVLLGASLAPVAMAHKVLIMAWQEGPAIMGEVGFSGGGYADGAAISLQDTATGEVLATATTDEDGYFTLPMPEGLLNAGGTVTVVGDMGAGHRAEMVVEVGGTGETQVGAEADVVVEPSQAVASPQVVDNAALQAMMRDVVREELRPLRRELAAQDGGPGVAEVLGGIGWIVGLAGAVVLARRRKSPHGEDTAC